MRYQAYLKAFEAIKNSSILERPFTFLMHFDLSIFRAIDYQPVMPLDVEGLIYAGVGALFGFIFYQVIKAPGILFKRRPKTVTSRSVAAS